MMMSHFDYTFSEWLFLVENATVSQWLKMQKHLPVKQTKDNITEFFKSVPFFQQLAQEKSKGVGEGLLTQGQSMLVNFFTYQYLLLRSNDLPAHQKRTLQKNTDPQMWALAIKPDAAGGNARRTWQQYGDFVASNWPVVKSKLNTANYTLGALEQDSQQWHLDLAARERSMPSEEYKAAIDLSSIGWKGWKWANLERGYCSAEAEAMGHCGNSGARDGDNIMSLRDPEGYAHLTFIINNKTLGEMKGRANSKPVERYHPAIVALLKSEYVDTIRGGGYAPENNFAFGDLSPKLQKDVKKVKPHIDDWLEHALASGNYGPVIDELEVDAAYFKIEGDEVTLAQYAEIPQLNDLISGDSFNFYFGQEDNWEAFDPQYIEPNWSDIDNYLDDELREMMLRFAKENPESMDDDLEEGEEIEDAQDAFENFDQIRDAMTQAMADGNRIGAENEAWKSLQSQLKSGDDEFGTWIDISKHPYI